MNVETDSSYPPSFLATYDAKTGVEIFEIQFRGILKLLSKLMSVWIIPILSDRYFHQWKGSKIFQVLKELRLFLGPEKTFVGRSCKDFDLLGYHITPQSFSPSQKTQEKALENAKQRYAQGGQKSLAEYLNRWRTWIYAGLLFKVAKVDAVADSIRDSVVKGTSLHKTQEQSRVRCIRNHWTDFEYSTCLYLSLIRSDYGGDNNHKKKGKALCIKNFSVHQS
jgi:hypothetical protein